MKKRSDSLPVRDDDDMPSSPSDPKFESFRALVQLYHARVLEVISRIQAQYGAAHIEAVLEDRVPWAGELPSLTFHYHGLGFTAQLDGYTVKWDWVGDDMAEFDIWALAQFTQHRRAEFGVWAEDSVLRAYARELAEVGILAPTHSKGFWQFNFCGTEGIQ